MPEWTNGAVLKTVEGLRPPWVRIPPLPPSYGTECLLMESRGNVKGDWVLLVVVIILGASFFVFHNRRAEQVRNASSSLAVVVEIEGQVVQKFDLAQDLEPLKIETRHGFNTIEIKDEKVRVVEADCPDLICVYTGWRGHVGQLIVCMPHYFVVKIVDDEAGPVEVDSFTY